MLKSVLYTFLGYLLGRKRQPRDHFGLNSVIFTTQSGRYTGFFEEFPEIIAEGETEIEVRKNLFKTLEIVLEHKRQKALLSQPQVDRPQKRVHHTLELAS
jgi:predicted RNase H-like HicB family nuclease